MSETIVHTTGETAAEIAEPIVETARDASEALAHTEHHAEAIAAHETRIETQEDRLARLEAFVASAPQGVDEGARAELAAAKSEISELRSKIEEMTREPEPEPTTTVEPPKPVEHEAPKKESGGIRGFLKRLI